MWWWCAGQKMPSPTAPPYMQAMVDFHFGAPDFKTGWQAGGIG